MMEEDSRTGEAGLADRLKTRTELLHREAERSGIIQDLLRGRAGVGAYALLLRNLLPVYEALETCLEATRSGTPARALARPEVYRAAALRSDLAALGEPGWAERLPVLPSASDYAGRIMMAAEGEPDRLLAHAYVRYLGDLNGGQILKRLLAKHLGLGAGELAFYDFPAVADPHAFARHYRSALDEADLPQASAESVIEEACLAFRLNIALSESVARADAMSVPSRAAALA